MELLNSSGFKNALDSNDIVVIDFSATWCGPCRMIAPFLEEIEKEMPEIKIFKVDIDEDPDLATDYDVMSVPTLILFKKGEKVSTCVGAASKARLIDWIKSHI